MPLLPPPIFTQSTVLGELLFSSLAYLGMTLRRSAPYFCGQWHCSQVSRAGRRLWTGVGMGVGYECKATATTCRSPEILLFTNQPAPGPMWHCTHSTRECGES